MNLFIFLIFLLWSFGGWAGLDEVTISTEDESCSIHYLSTRAKNNWTIKVNQNLCRDGWVDGTAEVYLYSPTKEKMEILSGFFSQGYWLDTFPPVGRIIDRNSPNDRVQSLSFLLGEDSEAGITYVGQLRSVQQEGRPYGPFQGCPDFRVLVVVSDASLFQSEAFLDKIVHQGLKYAHSYCAAPEVVALFGATSSINPDIIFQMQVDPVTGDKTVIPVSPKKNKVEAIPSELREEVADVLLSVRPEQEKAIVSYKVPKPVQMVQPTISQKKKDILGDLTILSRISKSPVSGRTVVHIKEVSLDGTGITDLPEEIQLLYYPDIKTGWAVVEGTLQENKMRVSNIEFCKQEWCTDVP